MERKRNFLKSMVAVAILVILAISMFFVYQRYKPTVSEGSKEITIQLVVPDANMEEFVLHTDAEYLRQALDEENLIHGSESQYGFFITEVNGITAKEANQEWWCITQKGEDVLYGVDEIAIQDGDQYELTLKVGY